MTRFSVVADPTDFARLVDFMDLSERSASGTFRHPWEVARLHAVARLLATHVQPAPGARVLDLGCGDGYVIAELAKRFGFGQVTACDIELGAQELERLRAEQPHITLTNDRERLAGRFELILLLDVVEHVANDVAWLEDVVERHLAPGGRLLLTVPAFQVLFNRHDRFLKHFRRYTRGELLGAVQRAGLVPQASGYFFASLLLPRALSKLGEVLAPGRLPEPSGVGAWRHGRWLSASLERCLQADIELCLAAERAGVVLPGLSCWLTCTR